jgi:hypothetical protein
MKSKQVEEQLMESKLPLKRWQVKKLRSSIPAIKQASLSSSFPHE